MCSRTINIATGILFTWRGAQTVFTLLGVLVHEAQKICRSESKIGLRVIQRVENHDPGLVCEG
jgi:hypothetical protein